MGDHEARGPQGSVGPASGTHTPTAGQPNEQAPMATQYPYVLSVIDNTWRPIEPSTDSPIGHGLGVCTAHPNAGQFGHSSNHSLGNHAGLPPSGFLQRPNEYLNTSLFGGGAHSFGQINHVAGNADMQHAPNVGQQKDHQQSAAHPSFGGGTMPARAFGVHRNTGFVFAPAPHGTYPGTLYPVHGPLASAAGQTNPVVPVHGDPHGNVAQEPSIIQSASGDALSSDSGDSSDSNDSHSIMSYEEYLEQSRIPIFIPPKPDPTFPSTAAEQRQIVIELIRAMRDISDVVDKRSGAPFRKRWAPGATYYSALNLERTCWFLLKIAMDIHTDG